MSKRDLKKYLNELKKVQLEEQIMGLYEKFPEVREYYNFVFNPKEEKLVQEAKLKISNEYFPVKTRKAKLRRSTSQKFIKHFINLGVDSFIIADLMLYNIEIAQSYTAEKIVNNEAFFKSMLNSFDQAINFIIEKEILYEYKNRAVAIKEKAFVQDWVNKYQFNAIVERFE